MQKEDEATTMGVVRGASLGEVPVTQVIPTVFIWHLELADDHLCGRRCHTTTAGTASKLQWVSNNIHDLQPLKLPMD